MTYKRQKAKHNRIIQFLIDNQNKTNWKVSELSEILGYTQNHVALCIREAADDGVLRIVWQNNRDRDIYVVDEKKVKTRYTGEDKGSMVDRLLLLIKKDTEKKGGCSLSNKKILDKLGASQTSAVASFISKLASQGNITKELVNTGGERPVRILKFVKDKQMKSKVTPKI